jgi:hypothetical protein
MHLLRATLLLTVACGLANALFGAAIAGGLTTFVLYGLSAATLGPLGPIATTVVFAGSTLAIDTVAGHAVEQQIKQRVEEPLTWHNCSVPSTVRIWPSCSTTGPKRHQTTTCSQAVSVTGAHGCNACGSDALIASRLTNPTDINDMQRHLVCKPFADPTAPLSTAPPITVPRGHWDCKRLPNYKECKLCGTGTVSAGYDPYLSNAGLLLNCRRENGDVDQMFVQSTVATA